MKNKEIVRRWMIILLSLCILIAGTTYWFYRKPLVIAPMLGGLNACILKKKELAQYFPNTIYTKACLEDETSASVLVERSLGNISKNTEPVGNFQLGYTLNVPLLHLFELQGEELKINKEPSRMWIGPLFCIYFQIILRWILQWRMLLQKIQTIYFFPKMAQCL